MSINKITQQCVARFIRDKKIADDENINLLNDYQDVAIVNANWPGRGTTVGLSYIAGKLNGEAGEMAGQVFKAWRDDGMVSDDTYYSDVFKCAPLEPERRAKIVKELGDVLWYVAAMASELNMTLSDVAIENLENLAGRTERGTLQGDGDR